jgi:hypothetical protein
LLELEAPHSVILDVRESGSVVVSDILLGWFLTELLVGSNCELSDNLLAVTILGICVLSEH